MSIYYLHIVEDYLQKGIYTLFPTCVIIFLMSNDVAVVEKEDHYIPDNAVSLKTFPPILRKLAKHILKNDDKRTLDLIAKDLKLNKNSIYTEIWKARKKGIDFHQFIEDVSLTLLNANLISVDAATLEGAVSGTHNDRKLYYQRIGKLTENTVNTTSITLNVGINAIPQAAVMQAEEKGIVDVEPVIPEDD